MIRVNIVVEGQTELEFIGRVLRNPLANRHVFASARCVETHRDRRRSKIYRGGVIDYDKVKRDLLCWMKQDQHDEVYFTTMIDLFRLLSDFPGYEQALKQQTPYAIVDHLEDAFQADIKHPRFVPYIQLHEFEALLLSDPSKFDRFFIHHEREIRNLTHMVDQFESPELINLGDTMAPSKRIIEQFPDYEDQKAAAGPIIAEAIGLDRMRERCKHFNAWIQRLETLGADPVGDAHE